MLILLVVFPALRCFTDAFVTWVQQAHFYGYDLVAVLPELVRRQARECKALMGNWSNRPFDTAVTRHIASDASDHELGGIDLQRGRILHDNFRRMGALHIHYKEWVASEYVVLRVCDMVRVLVDNSAALFYLLKGDGR